MELVFIQQTSLDSSNFMFPELEKLMVPRFLKLMSWDLPIPKILLVLNFSGFDIQNGLHHRKHIIFDVWYDI